MDFLALLKGVEDGKKLERAEFLNDQILRNTLPSHIAFNYGARSEPFSHLCPSVGILCAKIGRPGDWVGEFGFDRLNRLVCEIDQRLGQLSESSRLEKVKTSHCFYTAACGILPELAKNVHDVPCTIGEQLTSLAELAQFIQDLAESEALDIAIGLDCGSALSVVVGGDKPRYELLGQPNTRSRKLAEAASSLGNNCILLSEDVFLALRPRSQFYFDENNALSVGPGLVAYSLLRSTPTSLKIFNSPLPPPLPPHKTNSQQQQNNENLNQIEQPHIHSNPLAAVDDHDVSVCNNNTKNTTNNHQINTTHSSIQSLCSSELFSIDLNLETDSLELEWVTPEMVANGQYRLFPESPPNKITKYKADRADVYSELSSDPESRPRSSNIIRSNNDRSKIGSFKNKLWRQPSSISNNRASYSSNNTSLNKKSNKQLQRSDYSLSLLAGDNFEENTTSRSLQRLNKAANRMNRMLKEMAGVPTHQNQKNKNKQHQPSHMPEYPFPCEEWNNNNNGTDIIGGHYYHHNKNHSMSEYENANTCSSTSRRSLASCYLSQDFESAIEEEEKKLKLSLSSLFNFNQKNNKSRSISKLEKLRQALVLNNNENKRSTSTGRRFNNKIIIGADGNEADRSCSPSIGSMQQFSPTNSRMRSSKLLKTLKFRQSVSHSIGYDDEYEIASAPLSSYNSSISSCWENNNLLTKSVGENEKFIPIDDDEEEDVQREEENKNKINKTNIEDSVSLKKQMLELTSQIRRDFGEFQLSRFSNDFEENTERSGRELEENSNLSERQAEENLEEEII